MNRALPARTLAIAVLRRWSRPALAIVLLLGLLLTYATWIRLDTLPLTGRYPVGRPELIWTDPWRLNPTPKTQAALSAWSFQQRFLVEMSRGHVPGK